MFEAAPAAIPSTIEITGFLQFHNARAALETSSIAETESSPSCAPAEKLPFTCFNTKYLHSLFSNFSTSSIMLFQSVEAIAFKDPSSLNWI